MDIYYELHNITFVWDKNKARTNTIKDDEIRIISARKATRKEKFDYEN